MDPTAIINWNPIILSVIAGIVTMWGGWMTYIAQKTHKAVNSERTAMQAELKRMNDLAAKLEAHAARLEGPMPDGQTAQSIVDASAATKPLKE